MKESQVIVSAVYLNFIAGMAVGIQYRHLPILFFPFRGE
ncbi:hypothetical protein RintRC_0485 [Richelia intracellularis]|nr:hypothetical protein RintRC_0485 [Richelia intracellularis]